MEVVPATHADVESWLDLAGEVEPLFGPMPDFREVLTRNIHRGSALVARDEAGRVTGGLLFSVTERSGVIGWLAVRSGHRRVGVGRALVEAALGQFATLTEVRVDTFGREEPAGAPARRLYESVGFVLSEKLPTRPDGVHRDRWIYALRCQ